MRSRLTSLLALLACVGLVGGCFAPPASSPDFSSNATAKELLGGTTWSDPQGSFTLTFDSNGKLIDIQVPSLPAEFQNMNITGEPFDVKLPPSASEITSMIGTDTVSVSILPTSTTLADLGNGSYGLEMNFRGDVGGAPLVALAVDHAEMTFTATLTQVGDGYELTNLAGNFAVMSFLGGDPLFQDSIAVNQTVPLTLVQ